jgi:hypothetical protein
VIHTAGGPNSAARFTAAGVVAANSAPASAVPGGVQGAFFIGPVIRSIVWYGNRSISLVDRLLNPSTRLGRIIIQLFGPFSVPTQTGRTIAYDIAAEIVTRALEETAFHWVGELAKREAIDWYRARGEQDSSGNVSVVFVPLPGADLPRWDP